ncbi:uncharacterized protein L969DRAFT_627606 [Mixia osmundae IAM 14324]|uniref:Major facilitator superfamily (MFS) profile domain-containing protein n=1 Tax=Mixia osmundae (strain CBS 9802 / IAM 14324 / JCM 22182 / KY 12970) TaxID=764103 RepID=G7E0P3_MIXOS|nr:uncharacterized protein L969DRAFT_627606 [Mixia osmundae IAM 14324]KEI37879.1 hypothetical protein L969DRAFT_627606 [Mixia osmundae IAM 14324]GAA96403.1 hypothetical protein E5Q_03070 [Mixia osmundae IAM 14324]
MSSEKAAQQTEDTTAVPEKTPAKTDNPSPRDPASSTDTLADPTLQRRPSILQRKKTKRTDGKRELTEAEGYEVTGYCFSTPKKWIILSVIFAVQISLNFNASIIGNAIMPISEKYGITEQKARLTQGLLLIFYGLGCELWAAPSEEYGRWPILQLSMLLVNVWQILAARPPTFGALVVARVLGGISSAGGSVTLAVVADLYETEDHQYALLFIVFSSVGGSVLGPIFGSIVQAKLSLQWIFWVQLIVGGVTQALHFFLVPETRSTILLDREAKRRRKSGEDDNIWGPNELREQRLTFNEFAVTFSRPFIMFVCEPIVLCLSLLSGFSDALIFSFLESYSLVFGAYNFSTIALGMAFTPILIGYFLCYFIFIPEIMRQKKAIKKNPDIQPESKLYLLLWLAPLEAIGLLGFAWTSTGPPIPWIAPLLFSALIGIANFAIYFATIDYLFVAYREYAASATGGNGLARDGLAGIATFYSVPLYSNLGQSNPLAWASTLLGILAALVTIPIFVFYWKGDILRERSKFAQSLASDRKLAGSGLPANEKQKDKAEIKEKDQA